VIFFYADGSYSAIGNKIHSGVFLNVAPPQGILTYRDESFYILL
jgi:hypothetical protein